MTDKLTLIIERIRPGRKQSCFRMYACRGANKGCELNVRRSERQKGKKCPDCVPCDDMNETLDQLMARISKGDG